MIRSDPSRTDPEALERNAQHGAPGRLARQRRLLRLDDVAAGACLAAFAAALIVAMITTWLVRHVGSEWTWLLARGAAIALLAGVSYGLVDVCARWLIAESIEDQVIKYNAERLAALRSKRAAATLVLTGVLWLYIAYATALY